ncbi:uncharacterized protein [Oscarella lobularis]|uniref:uncharacterized protein n=1 Tax=Oscarella lobularis TaxID=121494 RepID=UPI00331440A1
MKMICRTVHVMAESIRLCNQKLMNEAFVIVVIVACFLYVLTLPHVRSTFMALQGGARNAKLKLFAIVCGMLVLAIASVPSLVFVFPDWGLSSERLEEIAAKQNVSFINGSSCHVEVALPSSVSKNLFEQEGVQQRLLSLVPSLLPLLSTPKCSQFLNVLIRPQSSSSEIFQTLSPFEIRGIMRTLNLSYDQLTAGIGLANISSSALVSLMNSYCLDEFSNLGCQKDLTFENGSIPCCYVSCLNWQWLGETKSTIDSVLFAVTAVVGLVEFVAASVAIIAIKSKQKFPHLVVSFYIMLSLVSLIFAEAVGRILGRENAICCDERDLLKALQSDSCTFSIIRTIIQNFCFTSGVSWCVVGFVNLWFAIVRSKSRVFVAHRNAIHAIEASIVWGTSLILALIPYWFKGGGAYYNPLLCYACSIINSTSFNYFTLVLPQQVIMAVGGLCVVHLVYTLKKQSFNRKELFASVQGQDAKQTKHVSQLDDLQRRFVFLLIVVFIVEIVVILNGFIVVMVRIASMSTTLEVTLNAFISI